MLIPAEELTLPTDSTIPLQLMKLRDAKPEVNEKSGTVLDNKAQQDDKNSDRKFEKVGLFDDLPMNEPCPDAKSSICMDIFAEYESEKLKSKQHAASSSVVSSDSPMTRNDETNEEKAAAAAAALKLIPNQLLIRRTNEQAKPKRTSTLDASSSDPAHHTADHPLAVQMKESHATKSENAKEAELKEKLMEPIKSKHRASNSSENNTKLLDTTEFAVAPKSSEIATRRSRSPPSEKISARSDRSEKENCKNDNGRKYKTGSGRNISDVLVAGARSPVRERKKRSKSPSKKESEKRYSHDYNKDKKERRSDDADKTDSRKDSKSDSRSARADLTDNRRKSSPSTGRRSRRSKSPPLSSWERQESRSPDHSWSRSRSVSPKRKDEAFGSARDREKRRDRFDDERSSRSRDDKKKERYSRSSSRSDYNEEKKGHNNILLKTTV